MNSLKLSNKKHMVVSEENLKKIDQIVMIYKYFPGNGKIAKSQRKENIEKILGLKLASSPTDNTLVSKALLKYNDLKSKDQLSKFNCFVPGLVVDEFGYKKDTDSIASLSSGTYGVSNNFLQSNLIPNNKIKTKYVEIPISLNSKEYITKEDLEEVLKAFIDSQQKALEEFRSLMHKLLFFKD